jgi:hypothetical protein
MNRMTDQTPETVGLTHMPPDTVSLLFGHLRPVEGAYLRLANKEFSKTKCKLAITDVRAGDSCSELFGSALCRRRMMRKCIEKGALPVLQAIMLLNPDKSKFNLITAAYSIGKYPHTHMCEWFLKASAMWGYTWKRAKPHLQDLNIHMTPGSKMFKSPVHEVVFRSAARHKNIPLLNQMMPKDAQEPAKDLPVTALACEAAAHGQYTVLRWMLQERYLNESRIMSPLNVAIRHDHLSCAIYLYAQLQVTCFHSLLVHSIRSHAASVTQWLVNQAHPDNYAYITVLISDMGTDHMLLGHIHRHNIQVTEEFMQTLLKKKKYKTLSMCLNKYTRVGAALNLNN